MIIFAFPTYEKLAANLIEKTGAQAGDFTRAEAGDFIFRHFPDGESYIKINSDIKNKKVVLLCGLENPDEKIMALMFFVKTAKELGAKEVGLIAPYLGYMRMDKRFSDGEAISSKIFAEFLSKQIDWLITVDPHLHRHKSLEEIYSIPCQTLHADEEIASWIKNNVENPLLIGPDEESLQWVSEIAKKSKKEKEVPFLILQKIRNGDRDVEISLPRIAQYPQHQPVLIDDIISTARTMIAAAKHLRDIGTSAPISIAVHAIFADDAFLALQKSGVKKIITCNSIAHSTNAIDLSDLLAKALIK